MPVLNPAFDPKKWQFRTYSNVDFEGKIIPKTESDLD